jgi:hypothetical protein
MRHGRMSQCVVKGVGASGIGCQGRGRSLPVLGQLFLEPVLDDGQQVGFGRSLGLHRALRCRASQMSRASLADWVSGAYSQTD